MTDAAAEAAQLAQAFLAGELPLELFTAGVRHLGVADIGSAQLDLDRARRCGFPEVVFGQGKSVEALAAIFARLLAEGIEVLATRITIEQETALQAIFPTARYSRLGRTLRIPKPGHSLDRHLQTSTPASLPKVAVITAGTSDLPVAEEVRETCLWMGCVVELIVDIGVAGPHRLPAQLARFADADAVVVVAGMEGALPSVVGGYVASPVIAVPTSVGYGANLGGIAALLSMLNSCAANVTVVNIDAGFKGGYIAGLIATRLAAARASAASVPPAAS